MKLSLIVCTHNRPDGIKACVDSMLLSIRKAMPVEAEIIVVANACSDDYIGTLKSWAAGATDIPIRILSEPRKGAAYARNMGLKAAQGDVIFITDDDCKLDIGCAAKLLAYDAADSGAVIRGGRIELGDAGDLPLTIKTEREPQRWMLGMPGAGIDIMAGKSVTGCNVSFRRSTMEKLGLFDERFGPGTPLPAGEDTDYYLRAFRAGIPVEYVPDIVIYHHHGRKSPADGFKLISGYTTATGGLYGKYLFIDRKLCHELYWDIKKAIGELGSGRNDYLPKLGFSYRNKVYYSLLGLWRYFRITLAQQLGLA